MATRDHAAKRAEILHAVWAVIARRGIAAVSVRSVAAEAGVSAGRVQHYFASKDDLVRASAREMVGAAERFHAETVAGATPEEELWHVLAHAFPVAERARAGTSVFYSYVAAGVADPEIAGVLAEAKSGAEAEAARLLAECAPGVADPVAAARILLAAADGLTLRVLVGDLTAAQAEESLRGAVAGTIAV